VNVIIVFQIPQGVRWGVGHCDILYTRPITLQAYLQATENDVRSQEKT